MTEKQIVELSYVFAQSVAQFFFCSSFFFLSYYFLSACHYDTEEKPRADSVILPDDRKAGLMRAGS